MNYSLHDRVLFALLVLPEEQLRKLVVRFDAIAADPLHYAQVTFQDDEGRRGYVCTVGRVRLDHYIAATGHVTFADLRHDWAS